MKTAVQWLFEAYRKEEIVKDHILELFKKAEEMEKEKMIQFANDWYEDYCEGSGYFKYPKDYYNQTFKSEE